MTGNETAMTTALSYRYFVKIGLFALAYLVLAQAGVTLAATAYRQPLIWPPVGLALAIILLYGYNLWPGIAIGAFVAVVFAEMGPGLALNAAVAGTLEVLLGAYLLRRWANFHSSLNRVQDVLGLIFFAVLLSPAVGAIISMFGLGLNGTIPWPAFGLNWAVRWLSHAIGLLIVTPMVLTWAQRRHINWSLGRLLEAGMLLLVVLLISLVVFNPQSNPNSGLLLLLYTIFPLLTWVAVRFGPRETVSISLVSSLVAAMGTARGVGPFARPDIGEGILLLWAYVSTTAMIALFLSASIQERRQFVAAFQRTLNQNAPPQAAVPLPESTAPVLPLLSLTPRLTLVALGSLIVMFIYGLTTNLLWPQLTTWLSGAITVVFSTVVACIGSYVVLRRQQTLYEQIFENVIERKRLEADQRRSKIRTQELERVTTRLQQEINERQKAEKALRHSEEKYRAIVENQIDLVCRFRPDFTLTFVNQAYCNYFAKMPEELLGHSFLALIPQSRHAEVIQSISAMIESPKILLDEHQVLLPDGELVWQQWINVPMFDTEGHVIEFQAVGRDITELKTLEAHIKQSNMRLEQAIQEKTTEMERLMERLIRQEKLAAVGQISANIAHELRNPLAAVKQAGYYLNQLYLRGQLDAHNPKVVEHLRLIESEIDDTERVIQDLLEATRLQPYRPELFEIEALILEVAERTAVTDKLQLLLNIEPRSRWVWADPLQLRQVLTNLFSNAMQACATHDSLTVRVNTKQSEREYHIEIQDTGPGVAAEVIDKVFEPLYTTKSRGTGLGLSICKQIIENHGGTISLWSELGQGTTVRIQLPYQPVSQPNAPNLTV